MFLVCPDATPAFLKLFDLSIAPRLLFYSYIPIIILSLFFGFFVFYRSKHSILGKNLLYISIAFSLFLLNEIIQWVAAPVALVAYAWSLAPFFQSLIWFFTINFFFCFLQNKPISFKMGIMLSILLLPIIFLLPSSLNISYFDLSNCEGSIGYMWYYLYAFQILSTLFLIFWGIKKYRDTVKGTKSQILLLTIGSSSFLFILAASNIFGEVFKTYEINLVGPIGMVMFISLLAYLIVKYKTFNIKLLGAEALVIAIIILTGSQFFFIQNPTNRVLTAITLTLIIFFGWFLVKSVAKEAKQKEQLTQYSKELAGANLELQDAYVKLETLDKAKSEFVSIASHQLRTPLTAIKGYVSLMLEGDYGKLSKGAAQSMKNVYLANERLVKLVNSLLDMSRLEAGKLTLDFSPVKVDDLVADILRELRGEAENKKLKLRMDKDRTALPKIEADPAKLRDTLMNLVDNAIKYTNKGEVAVKIKYDSFEGNMEIIVQDTGEGMTGEEIDKLFQSFSRADSGKKNWAEGSGLGLYIAKKFIEMHHGTIHAESQGKGQGSRFIIELPISQPSNGVDTRK